MMPVADSATAMTRNIPQVGDALGAAARGWRRCVHHSHLITCPDATVGSAHSEVADGDLLGGGGLKLLAGHDRHPVAAATPAENPLAVASRARPGDARTEPEVAAAGAADRDVEVVDVAAASRSGELDIERDALCGKGDLERGARAPVAGVTAASAWAASAR